jgi:hypothetical protein
MNFLELVTDLAREAAIPGTIPSVSGQTGEAGRAVNWVLRAYRKIQGAHPYWRFMRREFAHAAGAGINNLTATAMGLTTFGKWRADSFRAYKTSIGVADEQVLTMITWDQMRDTYLMGAQRTMTGPPQYIAVKPDQSLQVWPTLAEGYTIVGEYYMAPQTMAANADEPVFPAAFHDAITWRALMYYAAYEGDASLYATAQNDFNEEFAKLEMDQVDAWADTERFA